MNTSPAQLNITVNGPMMEVAMNRPPVNAITCLSVVKCMPLSAN
jgi:hypothetical protein